MYLYSSVNNLGVLTYQVSKQRHLDNCFHRRPHAPQKEDFIKILTREYSWEKKKKTSKLIQSSFHLLSSQSSKKNIPEYIQNIFKMLMLLAVCFCMFVVFD